MEKINVIVGGDTGYGGRQIVERLKDHDYVNEVIGFSREFPDEEELGRADAAISAFPSPISGEKVARLHEAGLWVADLSGDFRLKTPEEYRKWYKHEHLAPELLKNDIPYVMTELNPDDIDDSEIVSLSGCFAGAIILPTEPLVKVELAKGGLIEPAETVRANAISGVSGMGKERQADADEIIKKREVRKYSPGRKHKHVPEMERRIGQKVFFVPSVGPYFQGIVADIDVTLKRNAYEQDVYEVLEEAYAEQPHVTVRPPGSDLPTKTDTAGTDKYHIGIAADNRELHLTVSVCNLGGGASAKGIMALNRKFGFPLMEGLRLEADEKTKTS